MMDDRVKCLVYQYLFRCLHDADVDLQKLDERLRSHIAVAVGFLSVLACGWKSCVCRSASCFRSPFLSSRSTQLAILVSGILMAFISPLCFGFPHGFAVDACIAQPIVLLERVTFRYNS